MTASVAVYVDDRAGSRDLAGMAPLNRIAELTRLSSGDVCFQGNGPDGPGTVLVGIEVKSIRDLLSSTAQGRLQATQVPAMLEEYDVSYLLYYGVYRPSPRDGSLQLLAGRTWRGYRLGSRSKPVPYGYLEGVKASLAAAGVRVDHVSSAREAAIWVGCLFSWWSKPWGDHSLFRSFDRSNPLPATLAVALDPDTLRRAEFASQFPGIGWDRAVAAARHFPSVRAMVNASAHEWGKVPGIGPVIARAAVEAVK